MFLILFLFYFFIHPSSSVIRKFNQNDFEQWIDEENFLVALFCNADEDKNCIKERTKLKELSEEMMHLKDIVFGYISKESDSILLARYNVDKIPMVKLFPYNGNIENYAMNIQKSDLKEMILQTRSSMLKKSDGSVTEKPRVQKQILIPEIDWMDVPMTVKDPLKHCVMILYDDDCGRNCEVLHRVAQVFQNEDKVAFFQLHFDKAGSFRATIPFIRNPTIFWYPQNDKENGLVYAGDVRFEVLVEFINDRGGFSRDYEGELKKDAGRIPEIDQIIRENILGVMLKTNINYVIFLVEKKLKEFPHAAKYIDYYLAILKEIRKGEEPDVVLKREQDYVNDMLTKKNLKTSDKDEWRKFYNIATAFIDFTAHRVKDIGKHSAVLKKDSQYEEKFKKSSRDEL